MRKVLQIALNTFRESVRDKVLYVIFFFAGVLMLASKGIGWVSVGEELQIVQHFSLATVSLFGALIAVFVGTGLIYKEIDKRTIYTVLSKPVERWQFVVGKYVGMLAVMWCVVIGMGLVSTAVVALSQWTHPGQGNVNWTMFVMAIVMVFFEMMVVTSLAILFSTLASPILAAIFTFCSYLIGQVVPSLMGLVDFAVTAEDAKKLDSVTAAVGQANWFFAPLSKALYTVLPNLQYFQLRDRVVYGPAIDHGTFWIDGEVGMAIIYALCYSAAVLLIATVLFDRRRF